MFFILSYIVSTVVTHYNELFIKPIKKQYQKKSQS